MDTRANRAAARAPLLLVLAFATGCIESVRVPLAVPLAPVGGSRPAGPQGIHFGAEFGDGVWGQEQERAEMVGGSIGFALRDRVEILSSGYSATRTVRGSDGHEHTGEVTSGVRGKIRLGDFHQGRASVAVHVSVMSAQRDRSDVQDDRLSAVDIAIPVEYYPRTDPLVDYRLGVFLAPRVVFQSFEDAIAGATATGTMVSGVAGIVGRWRYFAVTGEVNVAKTPSMEFGTLAFEGGVHLLPMLGLRGIIPIGD